MYPGPDPIISSLAGMTAGVIKCLVSHPFNTYKVYKQVGKVPPNDIKGLYQGIQAPMGRNALEHSSHMGFRDITSMVLGIENPFLVGLLSGIPQALFITPMDYACTRLQLGKPVIWSHCLRGIQWIIFKEMIGGMTFFGIYEGSKPHIDNPGVRGSLAAISAMIVSYPMDTIKTRHQALCNTRGGLAAGMKMSIVKCIFANYVAMVVFENVKDILVDIKKKKSDIKS